MQGKVKQKRRTRSHLNKLIIVLIISLYFISRMYPILGASNNKITIAQYGKIEAVVSGVGYIARDEAVYNNIAEGEIKYFVTDGEKVTKDQKLAEVHIEAVDSKAIKELEIINLRIKKIEEKQNEETIFQGDIEKLDNQINELLKKIQEAYKEQSPSKVSQLQGELKILMDKKNIIVGENSFVGKNLIQLQEQKIALEESLNSSIQVTYSKSPGFVAFGSDGLEDLLRPSALESISVKDIELIKETLKKSTKDSEDKPKIRIIRDHRWSIVVELDSQQAEGIQEARNIKLRKQGEAREYSAFVRRVITSDEKSLVVLDLSEVLEGYHSLRSINIDLVKNSYEGLMLPNQTIVEDEGSTGVFRIDVNGFANYVPVKIVGQNREYSILQEGTFQKEVEKDGKKETIRVNTINLYDEVLLKGNKGAEGKKVR